jgi:hypothetical protein
MYILRLNDMRAANVENLQPVARAETNEELQRFINGEKVDLYQDGKWAKVYKKGGPLEWYNAPYNFEPSIVTVGSADEWAANARAQFEEQIMSLPAAP